ncbi:MAG: SusC/RagA family TonB-linked outer membrane protein [Arachidicoccus sp.]|nr:SusC/RagA family TonB-linked outer membrane protein [Arachidicoccus sp.]
MKLTALLITVSILHVCAHGLSQQVTLSKDKADISFVLKEIHRQTGYNILWSQSVLSRGKQVSVNFKEIPLKQALDELFKGQTLSYVITQGKNIVIIPKVQNAKENLIDSSHILRGVVISTTSEFISDATIILSPGKKTVITDGRGTFAFKDIPFGKYTLHISHIGYQNQDYVIDFTGKNIITINMIAQDKSLNDVVIVGYQAVRRREVTGAVSSLKGEAIADLPMASIEQALQGRIAGLNVQNNTGEPGVSPSIVIRGNSKVSYDYDELNATSVPLYVIDGVEQPQTSGGATGTDFLAMFDLNDIESIDVLKDASATAIYGSRGANGVIIITTKAGKQGELKVNLDNYVGYTEKPTLRQMAVGTTERQQKLAALQSIYRDNLNSISDLPAVLTDSLNPQYNGAIDWQGENYREGIIRNTGININGGRPDANYRISFNNYAEQGIIRSSDFQRYSAKISLNGKSKNGKFTFSPSMSITYSSRGRGNGSTAYSTSYRLTNSESSSTSTLLYGLMPSSLYNIDKSVISTIIGSYPKKMDVNIDKILTFYWQMGYKFNKYFQITSRESYVGTNSRRDQYRTDAMTGGNGTTAYNYEYDLDRFSVSNYLTFSEDFNKSKHNITLVAGNDILYTTNRTTSISATGGSNDEVEVVNGYTQLNTTSSTSHTVYSSASFYSRLIYGFNKRYYVTLSGRRDGSSRFGDNSTWAFYPAASAGWIVSDEPFMKNQNVFNFLKLRATYGMSGNEPNKNYLQYNTFTVGSANYASSSKVSTYNGVTTITPNFSSSSQPNLTWEKTSEVDFGIDFELLNSRISSSIDFYNKDGTSQFYYIKLPVTTGFTTANTNAAGTRNRGMDISITSINFSPKSKFQWRTTLNVTLNSNKIMTLPNDGRDVYFGSSNDFEQTHVNSRGAPINTFYLYQAKGVYSTDDDVPVNPLTGSKLKALYAYDAGDMRIIDQDGDYYINIFIGTGYNPDKIRAGNPNPKFTGGFINDFTYKNWALSMNFIYVFGRDILNKALANEMYNISTIGTLAEYGIEDLKKLNMWMKPGDKASFPKFDILNRNYYYTSASTFFLENGNFIRLKTVSLGYNFNKEFSFIKKANISSARLYMNLDNVWLWKAAKSVPDPENVNAYGEYTGGGYAVPRKFTLGLNINF